MQPNISQALASEHVADIVRAAERRQTLERRRAQPRSSSGEPTRDTSVVRTRVTSSRSIGRAGELEELEHALREAAEQRPFVTLLGGESGVGKTRLVESSSAACPTGTTW